MAHISENLLDYTEFYDLVAIAEKEKWWPDLTFALGDRKDTLALLRRAGQLRNAVAHSRPILPFEADPLSGIAGEVRNRVTIYMSQTAVGNEYWARIESVRDSFGNVLDGLETLRSSNPHVRTAQTLRVGDVVDFECRATDPEGREITWQISYLPNDHKLSPPERRTGDVVTFRWTVQMHHVSTRTSVHIRMTAASETHRWASAVGGIDGMAIFAYTVLPAI